MKIEKDNFKDMVIKDKEAFLNKKITQQINQEYKREIT
jgi:hypothetical protein